MSYILLREAYIANIRNDTSKIASFKFTYKAISDVEDLPLPHMHTHTCMYTHTTMHVHTYTHTSSYVDETFS